MLTKGTSRWGVLGPYELKDEEGRIMENIWQFSKCYHKVDATTQKKSRFESITIWDHPSETHIIDMSKPITVDNMAPEYWAWRQKGFSAPYAVRYPPGFGKMVNCVGALVETKSGEIEGPLNYIESRKKLYLPLYTRLVRQAPLFAELRKLHKQGKNLLIVEVDGPHQEDLSYYQQTYGVGADFITQNSVIANVENLALLLNDPRHPFGHGYCLAAALADIDLLTITETSGLTLSDFTDEDLEAALAELTTAVEPSPVEPPQVWVFGFGCGGYGGPWTILESTSPEEATELLEGKNTIGEKKKLVCRATVVVSGNYYTILVFSTRLSQSPSDKGDLDVKAFRALLSPYRGSANTAEKYVVRQAVRGIPVSFQKGDDPFPPLFFWG